MATHVYKLALRRMIVRLKNPFHLTQAEQAKLDGLLTPDEVREVERLIADIRHGAEFMAWPIYCEVKAWYDWSSRNNRRLIDAINMAHWKRPYHLERYERYSQAINERRAAGFKNPNAYAEDIRLRNFHIEMHDSLISSVAFVWEKLTADEKRMWQPPTLPIKSLADCPMPWESWENAVWPSYPNSKRQAYIEVLTEKLDRLNREDL